MIQCHRRIIKLDQNKSKPVGLNESTLLAASIAFTEKQVKSVRSDINELYEVVQDIAQNKPLRGPEGTPGKNGAPGPQGDKGERGIVGAQGLKGDTGEQGLTGSKGDVGPQGEKGDTGEQGPKGEKGDTGEQGPKGDKGDTGERGLVGSKGDKGDTGEQGLTGSKGDVGPQGEKGDRGERGLKGDKGDTGKQGPKGEIGAQGVQGSKGDVGPQGEKGDRGLVGSKGDRGEKGDTGKDADIKPLEEKLQSFEKKIQIDLQKYKQNINQSVSKGYNGWSGDSGGGEVRLLRLDDVDTTNLANGKTLVYNANLKKLVFETVSTTGGESTNSNTITSNTITATNIVTQNAQVTGDFSVGINSNNTFISYANVDLKGNVIVGTNANNSLVINSRIASNIVPIADVQYSLGSPEFRFKDLFLSGNTVYIGSSTLSASDQGLVLPYGSIIGGIIPSDDISGLLNNFTGDLGNFDSNYNDSFGSQIRNFRIDFNQSGTLTQIQLGNL